MPHKDVRTKAAATGGQMSTSGVMNVIYRDAKGNSKNALVLGPGSSSGLKLAITADSGRVVDNVPLATTQKGTNVYFMRYQ